ncbi:MAG: histidine phosphatase family protein [Caldilineaceae bacterium]
MVDIHEHGGVFLGNPRSETDPVRAYTGLTRAEIEEKFPGYVVPAEISEKGWWAGGYETIDVCEERAVRVAAALKERAGAEPQTVIGMVTHGTFMDRLLKALLHGTHSRDFFSSTTTRPSRVRFHRGRTGGGALHQPHAASAAGVDHQVES